MNHYLVLGSRPGISANAERAMHDEHRPSRAMGEHKKITIKGFNPELESIDLHKLTKKDIGIGVGRAPIAIRKEELVMGLEGGGMLKP